jgi:hypothetical protein
VLLRENEGGAGFPLRVERVEGLLETFFRRFSGEQRREVWSLGTPFIEKYAMGATL